LAAIAEGDGGSLRSRPLTKCHSGYTTYATHFPNLEGKSVSISLVLNKNLPQTPFHLTEKIITHYVDSKMNKIAIASDHAGFE
jgi:hypothetical protein